MRFYSSTTPAETLAWLREMAVRTNEPRDPIDALDDLQAVADQAGEIEKLEGENGDLERDRNNLRGELDDAATALGEALDILASIAKNPDDKPMEFFSEHELKSLERSLKVAQHAVERHST